MNNIINKLTEKKGHTLVTVLLVMTVSVMLATILISVALSSYENSAVYYKQKQAYFTARSALDAFISAAKGKAGDDSRNAAGAALSAAASGYGTAPQSFTVDGVTSTYQYKFRKVGKRVKVTAYGAYQGETAKVSAYFASKPNSICPTECLFYCVSSELKEQNSGVTDFTDFDGRVVVRGSWAPNFNFNQTGDMVVHGAVHATGEVNINGKLVYYGDASLVSGNITEVYYKKDSASFSPPASVTVGDVHEMTEFTDLGVDPSMYLAHGDWSRSVVTVGAMTPGMENITVNATGDTYYPTQVTGTFAEGSVPSGVSPINVMGDGAIYPYQFNSFSNPGWVSSGQEIRTLGRSWTFNAGVLTDNEYTFNFNDKEVILPGTTGNINIKFNPSAYGGTFSADVGGTMIDLDAETFLSPDGTVYTESSATDCTIAMGDSIIGNSASEKIVKFTGNAMGGITFDTTDGDVRVICESATGDFNFNGDIKIMGGHQVNFYLANGTDVTISDNVEIGKNDEAEYADLTQFNLIGKGCNVTMKDKATFKGVCYLTDSAPGAADTAFIEEGSILTDAYGAPVYRIEGSVTAGKIHFTAGNYYRYIKPVEPLEFDATLPPQYFIPPKDSFGNFEFEKYGR